MSGVQRVIACTVEYSVRQLSVVMGIVRSAVGELVLDYGSKSRKSSTKTPWFLAGLGDAFHDWHGATRSTVSARVYTNMGGPGWGAHVDEPGWRYVASPIPDSLCLDGVAIRNRV